MAGSRPLTEDERAFATRFHNLIYSYLRDRNLNQEEFYDIVAFGFIRAVANFHDRADLRKYSFTTIAWRAMDSAYANYCKGQRCFKRCANAGALSLDAPLTEKGDWTLGDTIATADTTSDRVEYIELWCQIIPKLSTNQKNVLYMKLKGYSNAEIAKKCNVSIEAIEVALCRIRERSAAHAC